MRRLESFLEFSRWGTARSRLQGFFLASTLAGAGLLGAACGAARPAPAGYAGDDARAFVVKHRAELQSEIAAGSGPRIYDLAIIANCQDVPNLGRRLHRHQDDFFPPAAGPGASSGAADPASPGDPASPAASASSDAEVADRIVRFMSERRELRCLALDLSRTREMAAGRRHIGPRRGPTTARGGTP